MLPAMSMTPSTSLTGNLRNELMQWPPFAQMAAEHVERFALACSQAYYEPDESVLSPASGAVTHLLLVRRGSVTGRQGVAAANDGLQYAAGDMFPVGAALAARAVTSTYTSVGDTFCLRLPLAEMRALARDSAPFAEFLNRRVQQFLALSRQALQVAYASQSLAEQSLETPLRDLMRGTAVGVAPDAPLAQALQLMHDRRIGSVLVLAPDSGAALGILTRHDILGRITLAGLPLTTPISAVMSAPVVSLRSDETAQAAALAMSDHGIRHVPVADASGRVVGIVSERDLFSLQRLSLKQVSTALRAAPDVSTLRAAAQDIRRLARNLIGQGVGARQLTELISRLNDLLTAQLVAMVAGQCGVDMGRACWVAFGSEGRGEQTISTDQDNGLVFVSDDPERDRPAWLAFAREVNQALDACGYPLCKGNIMASNPECCLTQAEWLARFRDWIEHGAPEDLLKASIYFDLRALTGDMALARPLREFVVQHGGSTPRFLKQLGENALRNAPALNWHGGIDTTAEDGRERVDLKFHGAAIYVDAARLFALAHGVPATGTRARIEAATAAMGVPAREAQAWVTGFEYLQMLRLRVQLAIDDAAVRAGTVGPNMIDVGTLNDIDMRMLKESLRAARHMQQRIQLDFVR